MKPSEPAKIAHVSAEVASTFGQLAHESFTGYKEWAERYPFAATAAETVAAFAVKRAAIWTGKKFGFNFGNAHAHHYVDRGETRPVLVAAEMIVRAPVTEELIFRAGLTGALPQTEFMQQRLGERAQRISSIVSTIGFALGGHGFDPIKKRADWPKPEASLYDRRNGIHAIAPVREWNWVLPIGSLIGGEQYRRMYQKRGLGHAIGSHALNNALTLAWESSAAAYKFKRDNPCTKLTTQNIISYVKSPSLKSSKP